MTFANRNRILNTFYLR